MDKILPAIIFIAAAVITDEQGRLLFVRKTGTEWFMQAGGKIEGEERPLSALCRDLLEEINVSFVADNPRIRYLGCFSAPAANEPEHMVNAELYHIQLKHSSITISGEIAEAIWVTPCEASKLKLAPLTRIHVLPLSQALEQNNTTRPGV